MDECKLIFKFGLIFGLLISVISLIHDIETYDWNEVDVTITDINIYRDGCIRHYDVYIDYIYNSKEYSNIILKAYESNWTVGKELKVRINPSNQAEIIYVNDINIMFIIGISIIILDALLGVVILKGIKSGKIIVVDVDDIFNVLFQ